MDTENIEETSPEFEPLTSVHHNENSMSGLSDFVSVGSPMDIVSNESHDTNFNEFENNKYSIENQQQSPLDKNGITNHKNDNIKFDNVTKIPNNTVQLITNNSKLKSKHSSKINKSTSSQEKSSTHKSKDHNSNSHRSRSREKNYAKKRNNSDSKDRKNNCHNKHYNEPKEKDKKYKHDRKSYHDNRDKTPKRDRKNSRSDKKEKSSSLCKEPKLLNGNRSDDESNAGGSSNQKSSINKNKSSTSDKSKSSSTNHKSSKKDNSSKDVVDKLKDKISLSKNSNRSSHKRSFEEDTNLSTNNQSVESKKHKWSDFQNSSITNDEQDAANVLLSISEIPFENSHNDIITENIIFIEKSPITETSEKPLNITENKLEVQNNSNYPKYNDNIKDNFNLTASQTFESTDSVCEKSVRKVNNLFDEVCLVETCKNIQLKNNFIENAKIVSEHNKQDRSTMINQEEVKTLNTENILSSSVIQMTSECDTNDILKVPKLNVSTDKNNLIKKRKKYKNNESKIKKLKLLELNVEVPVNDITLSTVITKEHAQIPYCDTNIEINSCVNNFPKNVLNKNFKNYQALTNKLSENTFKGFSQSDTVFPSTECLTFLKNLLETTQKEIDNYEEIDNNGFIGFTGDGDTILRKNRDKVQSHLKLNENLGFPGFSDNDKNICYGCKYIKSQLELAKKQNDVDNQQKNILNGGNGIQNGTKFNEVMAIIYNNDNDKTPDAIYRQPNDENKKECSVVNNNNHDITASENWMARQEMKYKLLPVKVKLERLLVYNGENIQFILILFICTL